MGRLSRLHRAQPQAGRPRGAPVHLRSITDCSTATPRNPDFIQTYIFPGGCLLDEPASKRWRSERGLSWEDREGFRLDYAETLKRWRERYDRAVASGALDGFGEPFHNLWRYYLMYCEGGFRGGAIDVAQVTLAKT